MLKSLEQRPSLNIKIRQSLFAYMHTAQGGAAADTPRRRGGDSANAHSIRSGSGPRRRGPRRSFRRKARGARPGSAPRRASANHGDGDRLPAASSAGARTYIKSTVPTSKPAAALCVGAFASQVAEGGPGPRDLSAAALPRRLAARAASADRVALAPHYQRGRNHTAAPLLPCRPPAQPGRSQLGAARSRPTDCCTCRRAEARHPCFSWHGNPGSLLPARRFSRRRVRTGAPNGGYLATAQAHV